MSLFSEYPLILGVKVLVHPSHLRFNNYRRGLKFENNTTEGTKVVPNSHYFIELSLNFRALCFIPTKSVEKVSDQNNRHVQRNYTLD